MTFSCFLLLIAEHHNLDFDFVISGLNLSYLGISSCKYSFSNVVINFILESGGSLL